MEIYILALAAIILLPGLFFVMSQRPYYNQYQNRDLFYNNLPPPSPYYYNNREYSGEKSLSVLGILLLFGAFLYFGILKEGYNQNKDGPVVLNTMPNQPSSNTEPFIEEKDTEAYDDKNIFDRTYEQTDALDFNEPDAYDYENEDFPTTDTEKAYGEGTFYLQAGSFNQLTGAKSEIKRLDQISDGRARVQVIQEDDVTNFKILIGPFTTREEANAYKKRYPLSYTFVKDFGDEVPQFLN